MRRDEEGSVACIKRLASAQQWAYAYADDDMYCKYVFNNLLYLFMFRSCALFNFWLMEDIRGKLGKTIHCALLRQQQAVSLTSF